MESSASVPGSGSLRQPKRLLEPFPDPASVNFAIARRLGPGNKELKCFLRTLRSRQLSAFGIDPPPDNPDRHLKIRGIPWDESSCQVDPDWKGCLRAGQLNRPLRPKYSVFNT